ncbi:MAG: outer membrane protein assembly factor BamD [Planctomycetota bacterium]|nr:outer membrane protein assembly factor BamD [Planctomycetota bacterium]
MNVRRFLVCIPLAALFALASLRTADAKWVWTSETGLVDTDEYSVGDPQELFDEATTLMTEGKFSDAATEFLRIAEYTPDPQYKERSLFMAGEAFFKDERYHRAYLCYEEYLYNYPRTDKLRDALRGEVECGFKMMDGAKKEFLGVAILPGGSFGEQIVKDVLKKYPYEEFSEEANFRLASYYFTKGEYEEAEMEYDLFLQAYPDSAWTPTAEFRKGLANIGRHAGAEYDASSLENAKRDFEEYVAKNPHGDKVREAAEQLEVIAERLAEKEYEIGIFYHKREKRDSAVFYMESVVRDYPQTSWAQKAKDFIESLKNEKQE